MLCHKNRTPSRACTGLFVRPAGTRPARFRTVTVRFNAQKRLSRVQQAFLQDTKKWSVVIGQWSLVSGYAMHTYA
jgi:hypothetical protein